MKILRITEDFLVRFIAVFSLTYCYNSRMFLLYFLIQLHAI